MKLFRYRRILRGMALAVSAITALFPHPPTSQASTGKTAPTKNKKNGNSGKERKEAFFSFSDADFSNRTEKAAKYPWRRDIVTTTFWIGEKPTKNNPVPNNKSSWDTRWSSNYGGYDNPNPKYREGYLPKGFTPGQNPFYVALPYNDLNRSGYKSEASKVVPWFDEKPNGKGKSTLKGKWLAVRFGDRVCYAQWEDCGPFRTDHHEYVFGNERPRPNLNKGAGLDVSPAVRDYLGMNSTDVTDWKFVEFEDIPNGPWATHGDNNTFVQNRLKNEERLVKYEEGSNVRLR